MITGALILFAVGVIELFASFIPVADAMNNSFENAWTWANGFIANILWTIPRGEELFLPIAAFVAIMLPMMLWKGINWILRNR